MPKDFPDHPFSALLQINRFMFHATVNNEAVGPNTYVAEVDPSHPCASIGKAGTFHLHEMELGEVVVLPQ